MKKFIILAAALITLAALSSCNEQRKLSRARTRVIGDSASLESVGKVWESFHPCVNDTIIDVDTLMSDPIIVDAELDLDSLKQKICAGSTTEKIIRVPVPCPANKTIYVDRVVRDTRHEKILRDSLDQAIARARACEATAAGNEKTIADLRKAYNEQSKGFSKALTNRTLVMLIPIVLLLIIGFLLLKKKRGIL